MAIVAVGYRLVRRFEPGIEVPLHDMAIGTRGGIIGKIGGSVRVIEGVRADTSGSTNEAPQHNTARSERIPKFASVAQRHCVIND